MNFMFTSWRYLNRVKFMLSHAFCALKFGRTTLFYWGWSSVGFSSSPISVKFISASSRLDAAPGLAFYGWLSGCAWLNTSFWESLKRVPWATLSESLSRLLSCCWSKIAYTSGVKRWRVILSLSTRLSEAESWLRISIASWGTGLVASNTPLPLDSKSECRRLLAFSSTLFWLLT